MDCTRCNIKSCRTSATRCAATKLDIDSIKNSYYEPQNQAIVQAAAQLVDNGRAGTLGRLEELAEYSKLMNYSRIGLAYCWGMETLAAQVRDYFLSHGFYVVPVSCTVGALSQAEVNETSSLRGVSCNPLSQAEQLNNENIDIALSMGLCVGHDILFNEKIQAPVTTILVKDRVYNNNPIAFLERTK